MKRSKDGLYRRAETLCFRYKAADGRWREKSTGQTDRKLAKECKAQFMEELRACSLPTDLAKLTAAAAIGSWLASRTALISPNTMRSYRGHLASILRFFGERKLGTITNQDLEDYQCARAAEGKKNRTINHEVTVFSMVLKRAKLWKRLASDYEPRKVSKKSPRRALTEDELNRLITTAKSRREWETIYHLTLLAAQTGCRPCEIAGLKLSSVCLDPANPYLVIHRQTTKTDAGERLIPLNDVAALAARKLMERAMVLGATTPEHYLLPAEMAKHTKPSDPLYHRRFDGFDPTRHQRHWSASWRALREAANVPDVDFYCLRHTFITSGGEADVPVEVMRSLAGHMSKEMTEYYTDVRNKAKSKAAIKIGQSNERLLELVGLNPPNHGAVQ